MRINLVGDEKLFAIVVDEIDEFKAKPGFIRLGNQDERIGGLSDIFNVLYGF
jgi:hypothetical protein